MPDLEVAAGSIIGRDHLGSGNVLLGKNNQDAFHICSDKKRVVAVICDGCGSQAHSEVGANEAARFISEKLYRLLTDQQTVNPSVNASLYVPAFLEFLRQEMLTDINQRVKRLSPNGGRTKTINDFYLFTVIGAVVDDDGCKIFTLGDGCFALNGRFQQLGPFTDNEPPYLAYGLTGTKSKAPDSRDWMFKIESNCPLDSFSHVLIGSDGVVKLEASAEKKVPGLKQPVGPLSQFWENDKYFGNPDEIRRYLALINRQYVTLGSPIREIVREPGLLPDDTTLVVIRKKTNQGAEA
ncbi:MAG: protein phosphatase 2C domain-containing protein [Candidatus Buchananbacteria bacterium]